MFPEVVRESDHQLAELLRLLLVDVEEAAAGGELTRVDTDKAQHTFIQRNVTTKLISNCCRCVGMVY